MRTALLPVLAIAGLGFAAPSAAVISSNDASLLATAAPVWAEAAWPFPIDQWGLGKAFVCAATDCGVKISVYVRPKIGFCNCSTGVSDDAELERVSDTSLVSVKPLAHAPGRPIKIGWMAGLARTYTNPERPGETAMSVGFNDECDAVVALAVFRTGRAAAIEPMVLDFLNSRPMVLWAKKELGLEFVRRDW